MPAKKNEKRIDQLADLVSATRRPALSLDVLDSNGNTTPVDGFELWLLLMDGDLMNHPDFAEVERRLCAAYGTAGVRHPRTTNDVAPRIEMAQAAARKLGLKPPAPKSLETIAKRRQRDAVE